MSWYNYFQDLALDLMERSDFGRHNFHEPKYSIERALSSFAEKNEVLWEKIERSIFTREPLSELIHIEGLELSCFSCHKEIKLSLDGVRFYIEHDCEASQDFILEFELNVPSGNVLVTDDLREWFHLYGDYDINTRLGVYKTSLAMAKIGCAHGLVGNTCPGVWEVSSDHYVIANPGWEENEDDEDIPPIEIPPRGGKRKARIMTDLWWYSIVDWEEYVRRGGNIDTDCDSFKVRPGVYCFKHYHKMKDSSHQERSEFPYEYAEFFWVREPDPVVDLLAEQRSMNFTVGQVVTTSMKNYPTLYPAGGRGVKGVLDHIFCTIGGGGSWHPNGFVVYDPDMGPEADDIKIPYLWGKKSWYGLYEDSSAICLASLKGSIHLNPTFVDAARKVLLSIAIFGNKSSHANEKENRKLAAKCLLALESRYGHIGWKAFSLCVSVWASLVNLFPKRDKKAKSKKKSKEEQVSPEVHSLIERIMEEIREEEAEENK